MHDLHVPIAPSGLYWVTSLLADQLQIDDGDGAAKLGVHGLRGIDEPKFPKAGPFYRATQSFDVNWTAHGDSTVIDDPAKDFRITGRAASATGHFLVKVPKFNFSFEGTAESTVAFLGQEENGYYFQTPPG